MIYLDRDLPKPLYEQIYEQYREDILSGRIPGGTRLPATRRLALDLVVGRNTVENAYEQLLVEGYVTARVGSGYTVNDLSLQRDVQSVRRGSEPEAVEEPPLYDFNISRMDSLAFPAAEFRKYVDEAVQARIGCAPYSYPPRQGDERLRTAIAKHLYNTRGISANPGNIVIICGHQYSLDVVCTVLGSKQIRVAIEDPGFAGAHALFNLRRVGMTPIPVERDGADMLAVELSNANLLYLTPSHQYPTGAVLSIQKRLKAIEWAVRTGSYIIENDFDSDLRYSTRPIPPLYALDRSDRVIYIGTLSRPLALQLGFAYLVLPDELMKRYHKLYSLHYNSVPPLMQHAIAAFIESGACERYLDRFRIRCRKKHDTMLAETARIFGPRVTATATGAGLYVIYTISDGRSADTLIRQARERSVRVYSLENSRLDRSRSIPGQVQLGYGGIPQDEIKTALTLLNEAWFGGERA